jgi:hypothetical protein
VASELARELETYRRKLPSLGSQEGKFALVIGDELSVYESYADALKTGYERAGLTPFLVKKISATETVAYFTREIA